MITSIYKQSTQGIPTYNDGYFDLYEIIQDKKSPNKENIKLIQRGYPFSEESIGDKLKYELKSRNIDVVKKIKCPQEKSIDSLNVIAIDGNYFSVVNAYHFMDNGFSKTRLTLGKYKLIGDVIDDD
ncbi:MAG: hypothetical protein K2G03_01810 [Bacilli bacterium]|nr:hypothetical protein [Bacilli bacterium]